jgi:hypothetical protein
MTPPRKLPDRSHLSAAAGKTRITIRIDDDVLAWFRGEVRGGHGGGYQSLINLALRDYIAREPLEATLRRVLREELARAGRRKSAHDYDDEEAAPRALVADSGAGSGYGASLKREKAVRRRKKRP